MIEEEVGVPPLVPDPTSNLKSSASESGILEPPLVLVASFHVSNGQRFQLLLVKRVPLGEKGILPSDAAMLTWAAVSPEVARRVNGAERKRLQLLKHAIGDPSLVEFFYLAWLGFVARGQRVPGSRRRFPQLARMMLALFSPRARSQRRVSR